MALQFYGGGDLKSTSSDSLGSFSSYGGCCETGVDPATVLALIAGIYTQGHIVAHPISKVLQ